MMAPLVVLALAHLSTPTVGCGKTGMVASVHGEDVLFDDVVTLTKAPSRLFARGVLFPPAAGVRPKGVRLDVGKTWSLLLGKQRFTFNVPEIWRSTRARIVGWMDQGAWISVPGAVVWVDLLRQRAPVLKQVWSGDEGRRPWPLGLGKLLELASTDQIISCAPGAPCTVRYTLPGPIEFASYDGGTWPGVDRAWLLGIRGAAGGVYEYRVGVSAGLSPILLGRVRALCRSRAGWAWLAVDVPGPRRDTVRHYVAMQERGALPERLTEGEVLMEAIANSGPRQVPAEALGVALLAALRESSSRAQRLISMAVSDDRMEVRALLAELLQRRRVSREGPLLWLLAHDVDAIVRENALHAVEIRCQEDEDDACVGLLSLFLDDPDEDLDRRARDTLLEYVPEIALRNASEAYKMDLLSRMTRHGNQSGDHAALRTLTADDNPRVRQSALDLWNARTP